MEAEVVELTANHIFVTPMKVIQRVIQFLHAGNFESEGFRYTFGLFIEHSTYYEQSYLVLGVLHAK
jgi:hypothetical protein